MERALRLGDVARELGLLRGEPLLERLEPRLALLELLELEVDVGLALRLAQLQLGLALVELAETLAERVLAVRESRIAAREARVL